MAYHRTEAERSRLRSMLERTNYLLLNILMIALASATRPWST
jgi:hypothetical protein